MKKVALIPARYASTRFPGKPLVLIGGKPMIQRVYERVMESDVDLCYVATDDYRIDNEIKKIGGKVILTSPDHPSGTDRCGEAARKIVLQPDDLVVNIQGDEPFIQPEQINQLIRLFDNPEVEIGTLVYQIEEREKIENPNVVKALLSDRKRVLYFSRAAVPYIRNKEKKVVTPFYKHIGIYAYRYQTLQKLIALPQSKLEQTEQLEQLRWLEADFQIFAAITTHESLAVDTPADLEKINHLMQWNHDGN